MQPQLAQAAIDTEVLIEKVQVFADDFGGQRSHHRVTFVKHALDRDNATATISSFGTSSCIRNCLAKRSCFSLYFSWFKLVVKSFVAIPNSYELIFLGPIGR